MPTIASKRLVQLGTEIFAACGVAAEDSEVVSSSLVESNLLGHDSHGVIRIPQYVGKLKKGDVNVGAKLTAISRTSNSISFDGNWGFGQIMARRAMETVLNEIGESAIFAATLFRSDHVGRLGEYSSLAAERGFLGIIMLNNHGAGQLVAPLGGREARMAPTPISICAPSGTDAPVLMDFTASVVAEGKVRVALNRGEMLKSGCILDADGNPSNDPKDLYGPPRGTILPFGGGAAHKGYVLGFMIELLAGILSGAGTSRKDHDKFGNAAFMCVVNIEAFLPLADFCRQVQEFTEYIKTCPKAPGVQEILIPGEKEHLEHKKRLAEGIFLSDETWAQLCETAGNVGVEA